MRRWWIAVMALGASSVVVGIWLMRVTRSGYLGCHIGIVCDGRILWPYANLGAGLVLVGVNATLVAIVPAIFALVFAVAARWQHRALSD